MEPFQEAVLHALGFVAGHGIQRHGVDAAEDAVFNVGVVALEAAEQDLDLLPLGAAATVIADGAGLGKAAGLGKGTESLIISLVRYIIAMMTVENRNAMRE